jgi:hypothetical protein
LRDGVSSWVWCKGAIQIALENSVVARGEVLVAADWPRAGKVVMRGSVREERLAWRADGVLYQGLPFGVYRVTWNLVSEPDGNLIQGGRIVEVGSDSEMTRVVIEPD